MPEDADIYRHDREKQKARRMFDSSEARKAFENVLDHETLMALMKLDEREVIEQIHGTIESGKESLVFLADTPEGERVLVKIYMTQAGGFRDMEQYLRGDKRFRNFKSDRRSIIHEWCKKEYKNLKKAQKVLRCPDPIAFQKNILVMEFIGRDFSPFPKLKDVEIENPEGALDRVLGEVEDLWSEEQLVHGDLSEYNILVTDGGELVWIDFSQGVYKNHPEALNLLKRDVENIVEFFNGQGTDRDSDKALKSIISEEEAAEAGFNL
ncbi:MAG: serine protein kinase RIO [Candidatus Nanosalina sp.]